MKQDAAVHVMDNSFRDMMSPENVAWLRGVPMLLFVGGDNAVLSTEATERTYEMVYDAFGSGVQWGELIYKRRIVPGYRYFDCWMG
jgi:hypothetical protein